MKNINFESLSIKNFLSVGNDPVVIQIKPGINVITGVNKDKLDRRNGVGKSTIADALYFTVSGNTLRDIKRDNISNDSTSGMCEVILDCNIQSNSENLKVRIIRNLNPSKVLLFINDVDKTLDSIANTNDYIAKLLDCNQEVFENCVIMSVNNTLPFMGKKKQDKRKFIESIFNLEIFSDMLTEAKQRFSLNKGKLDTTTGKVLNSTNVLSNLKHQQSIFSNQKEEKVKKLNLEIANKIDEKNKSNTKLLSIKSVNLEELKLTINQQCTETSTKIGEVRQKIGEIESKESTLKGQVIALKKSLTKIESNIDECPVCLRTVTESDREHITTAKNSIIDEVNQLTMQVSELVNSCNTFREQEKQLIVQLTQLTEKLGSTKLLEREIDNLSSRIAVIDSSILNLQQQRDEAQNESKTFDDIINKEEVQLNIFEKESATLKTELLVLNNVKFVFSEEGIKAFLVKRMLDVFNSRLAYYLGKMDANCTCVFNEYFEEVIINDKGKPCSYYNFSGAERKNIDLACLFTFMDVRRMQGDVTFNFSLYDELLDSSLDEKGIELVISILNERVEKFGECILVISHRKESAKFATGDIVYLEKNNGITRRVDFVVGSL